MRSETRASLNTEVGAGADESLDLFEVRLGRDADNLAWNTRLGSFLDAGKPLSEDYKFTDPGSAVIQVGYRTFIDAYLGAAERAELEKALHDAIG